MIDHKALAPRLDNPLRASTRLVPFLLRLLLALSPLAACSCLGGGGGVQAQPQTPKVDLGRDRNALKFKYEAAADLNWYEGQPHTLMVAVVQMEKSDSFDNIRQTGDGLTRFLDGANENPDIKQLKRIIVQPGDLKAVYLDRVEGAAWVAIVAGYYDLRPGKVDRIFQIPVKPAKQKGGGTMSIATPMTIGILFGRNGIKFSAKDDFIDKR